ncbi:MAG TPA: DNA polymerase III subunit delta [Burkholderiaceae bacterium]|nr:DNA polymerase III subunit delta [Burkholderiaceae bacterium]
MIRSDALPARLSAAARDGLPPLVWIAGDEPLLVQEDADRVRAAARGLGFDERRVFHVERGFRPEELDAEAGAMSLFASRRLLELRMSGKPGKELAEAIADAAQRLGDDTRLLVVGPRLDRKATETAWFARIDRLGWYVPVPVVERGALPGWIGERLARQGQRADADTLRLIAERVEGNLLAAEQEVRKLALLFPQGALPAAEVRAAVLDVARWDVFDLVGAAYGGETGRALRCLAGLRAEGTAVPVALWALADGVRTLLRIALAVEAGRPTAVAIREARIWGERERAIPGALRRHSPASLRRLLRACARVDRMTKGLLAGDDWQALEAVVLGLAGAHALALDDPALAA